MKYGRFKSYEDFLKELELFHGKQIGRAHV